LWGQTKKLQNLASLGLELLLISHPLQAKQNWQQDRVNQENNILLGASFSSVDHAIKDGTTGLNPRSFDHETSIDIEPISGMTMNFRRRWQISLRIQRTAIWHNQILEPYSGRSSLGTEVTGLILPVYWCQESGYVSPSGAEQFKDDIYNELQKKKKLPIVCYFLGSLCLVASFALLVMGVRSRAILGQVKPNLGTLLDPSKKRLATTPEKNKPGGFLQLSDETSAPQSKKQAILRLPKFTRKASAEV
jgi:hypothetical protein